MKEGESFPEYIDRLIKESGEEKPPCSTREEGLASKTGQLCQKICEGCLRKMTLRVLSVNAEIAIQKNNAQHVELIDVLCTRYVIAPKESLIAYWCGMTDGAKRHTEKKKIYQILERQGRACVGHAPQPN